MLGELCMFPDPLETGRHKMWALSQPGTYGTRTQPSSTRGGGRVGRLRLDRQGGCPFVMVWHGADECRSGIGNLGGCWPICLADIRVDCSVWLGTGRGWSRVVWTVGSSFGTLLMDWTRRSWSREEVRMIWLVKLCESWTFSILWCESTAVRCCRYACNVW